MGKRYKCPYCELRAERKDLIMHVEEEHDDMIPKDYTASRIVYNQINKREHGNCMICKKETKWDEDKQRYDSLCESKKCHDEYVKMVRSRMVHKYGTSNLLKDPKFQKKMLAGRKISGKYKFKDGGSVGYVGGYEKKFLEFLDKFLGVKSYDIVSPGPTIPYTYKGKEHYWITDFLYEPYNLVFDIKDGGDNPNTRDMQEYREKQIAKEKAIQEYGDYNYIRLTDNKFEQLITMMVLLKEKEDKKPLIQINESYMISKKEGLDIVSEGFIFNKKNLYINYDNFKSGKSNILLVTGLSGSGKTTLGNKLAKEHKAELIELDLFEQCYMFPEDNKLKDACEPVYEYLSSKKELKEKLMNKTIKGKDLGSEISKFIKWCIPYCKKQSRKYIIEGVQIYSFLNKENLGNTPIVFVGTSALTSIIRRLKRAKANSKEDFKNQISELPQCIAWYVDNEKAYSAFKKAITESNETTDSFINTIIFDFGEVLVSGNFEYCIRNSHKIPQAFADELIEAWLKIANSDYDETISREEFIELVKPHLKEIHHCYLKDLADTSVACIHLGEHTLEILNGYKQLGYKIYYLSNWNKWSMDELRSHGWFQKFLELFDGGVFSYETGMKKPNPDIYKLLLDKYQIDPHTALFYDDKEENVNAARSIGLNAEVFNINRALEQIQGSGVSLAGDKNYVE